MTFYRTLAPLWANDETIIPAGTGALEFPDIDANGIAALIANRVIEPMSDEEAAPFYEPPMEENSTVESFRQGFKEAMEGNTQPIETLWDGFDAAEDEPPTTDKDDSGSTAAKPKKGK